MLTHSGPACLIRESPHNSANSAKICNGSFLTARNVLKSQRIRSIEHHRQPGLEVQPVAVDTLLRLILSEFEVMLAKERNRLRPALFFTSLPTNVKKFSPLCQKSTKPVCPMHLEDPRPFLGEAGDPRRRRSGVSYGQRSSQVWQRLAHAAVIDYRGRSRSRSFPPTECDPNH